MRVRLRAFALNVAIIGVASLIGLALMELVVRWKFPQPTALSHQDRYGLGMHWPGITRHLPAFGHDVTFNSVGMRDREHPRTKRPGDFRILVTGDSFMEAYQVPFEASMPALLEAELSKHAGRSVEVINASMSGWGTDDELRYYMRYARDLKPDLVLIAMTLHNDISDNLRQRWHREHEGRLEERDVAPIPWHTYKILQVKGYIATRMQLYQLWRLTRHRGEMKAVATELQTHVETLFDVPSSASTLRGMRLTELLLARFDSVVRADGGRLAVVLLPLQVQLYEKDFALVSEKLSTDSVTVHRERPQEMLREITARLDIPTIDLLAPFSEWTGQGGASLFLKGDGHWNEAGHRLATGVTVRQLLDKSIVQ